MQYKIAIFIISVPIYLNFLNFCFKYPIQYLNFYVSLITKQNERLEKLL